MYEVLERFNFGPFIITNIRKLYDGAESMVMINVFLTPCRHQKLHPPGMSLSAVLCAVCLDPLLRSLTESIQACRPPHLRNTPVAVAYVDDITLFLRSPQGISDAQRTIALYEQASATVSILAPAAPSCNFVGSSNTNRLPHSN
jgi:hypothetical protein